MPRNSAGNYVLPTGNPVQANTLIESAWANLTMEDIATALTDSLDRNGRGGMLAAFQLADGIVTQPGLAFANEPSMGIFRAGTRDMRATILGIPRMRWTQDGTEYWDGAAWKNLATVLGGTTGLGTAAFANLTTSATDSTVGRVLRVGDFGVGGRSGDTAQYTGDLNTLLTGGLYRLNTVTSGPAGDTADLGLMLVISGLDTVSQTLVSVNNRMHHRTANLTTSVWSPWRQVLNTGDAGINSNAASVANLNDIQATGFYRVGDTGGGIPSPGFWEVIHWQFDSASASQIAQMAGVQTVVQFTRSKAANVWGGWTRTMFTGDNLAHLPNLGTARANLGLGSAATSDVIGSVVDVSANKVLARGFFGLGANAVEPGNWNNILNNGWYMSSTAPNSPLPGAWMIGHVLQHNVVWHSQDIWNFTGDAAAVPARYWRQQNNGNWGPWIDQRIPNLQGIGSYVFAMSLLGTATIGMGTLVNGADLFPAGATHSSIWTADGATGSSWTRGGASLGGGTWRTLGRSADVGSRVRATLFQRIA